MILEISIYSGKENFCNENLKLYLRNIFSKICKYRINVHKLFFILFLFIF